MLKKLEDLNLCFQNCRGQGYDNGANMKGFKRGVQKRLLELNPKSFYVPCGCHSLNLILEDMAKSSVVATTLWSFASIFFFVWCFNTAIEDLENSCKKSDIKAYFRYTLGMQDR